MQPLEKNLLSLVVIRVCQTVDIVTPSVSDLKCPKCLGEEGGKIMVKCTSEDPCSILDNG